MRFFKKMLCNRLRERLFILFLRKRYCEKRSYYTKTNGSDVKTFNINSF